MPGDRSFIVLECERPRLNWWLDVFLAIPRVSHLTTFRPYDVTFRRYPALLHVLARLDLLRKLFCCHNLRVVSELHNVDDDPIFDQGYSHGSSLLSGISDRKSTRLNSSHVRISYAVCSLE